METKISNAPSHRRSWPSRVALLFLLVLPLAAAIDVPASLDEDNVRFELVGKGTFRWKRIVLAYDACLHGPSGTQSTNLLEGGPLRLEIHYRREFSAEDIVSGGNALLRRNISPELYQKLESRLEKLNRAYLSVKPGDRYTLTFTPEKGTTLRLNGRPLVTVEGADFAAAYFRIWLGADPISPALRDQLLGQKSDSNP